MMNRTNQAVLVSTLLSLGVSPALAGGTIRAIGWPIDMSGTFIQTMAYDNTARSVALTIISQDINNAYPVLYQYRDGAWSTVAQDSDKTPVAFVDGIADTGSSLAFSEYGVASVASGSTIERLPDRWIGADGQAVENALIYSTAMSGDGGTVGLYGYDPAVGGDVALVWRGGDTLESLDIGLPDSGVDNFIRAINRDGSVIVGNSVSEGQINNIRLHPFIYDAWVWRDGSLRFIDVPNNSAFEQVSVPLCVSADGSTVAGVSEHPTMRPIVLGHAGYRGYDPFKRSTWVWNADEGGTLISDPSILDSTVMDISADGNTLLLSCGTLRGDRDGSYLWTREGGFVYLRDLLHDQGVLGPEQEFECQAISDDARTLMGWYHPSQTGGYTLAFIDLD